jgi:hypothetical protein
VLTRKWMELAYFVPCLTSEFVDNQSKYEFAPKSAQGDVSCCLGCAGLPSRSQRPSHWVLRLFPPTRRRKVAGAAAVGVGAAVAVGVAVAGAAAAAAVKSGFRRLRRRAVAAAVGAAAVGGAPAGAAAVGVAVAGTGVAVAGTGVAVVGMGVVGNLWIKKSWLP